MEYSIFQAFPRPMSSIFALFQVRSIRLARPSAHLGSDGRRLLRKCGHPCDTILLIHRYKSLCRQRKSVSARATRTKLQPHFFSVP